MEGYQIIPISELVPSLTNPRKTFNDLEELTESVREKGGLQPILVRPGANHAYEIIAVNAGIAPLGLQAWTACRPLCAI